MSGRLLLVDGNAAFASELEANLRRQGHDVLWCASAVEARSVFQHFNGDVVILDDRVDGGRGLELLDEFKPLSAGAAFLVVSESPDLDSAVDAMRRGAFDYVSKGVEDRELTLRVGRAVEVALLRRRMAEASMGSGHREGSPLLLGESRAMRTLHERLRALSEADDTTVLILGETGTGKGVVARAIHAQSKRAYDPFIAVDCTTIPATLVESELFGFEKGAFSGADRSKVGRVEAAARGTLFLDEIGELELGMQAKLLRLLEEREFTRVGGTEPRRLAARIVTATNRRLDRAVREGRFRADLRFRLAVFVVDVPPLRDRGDDILILAKHFAAERARVLGRPVQRLANDVASALPKYPFPGNVRELRNMVEQAVLLSQGEELTMEHFPVLDRGYGRSPSQAPRPSDRPSLAVGGGYHPNPSLTPPRMPTETLDEIRRKHDSREAIELVEVLRATGGNVSAAARRLGFSRYQLLRRLRKHGLR